MKQRNIQAAFVLVFLCLPALVFSQDVEKIIAKHIAAHGGAKKWKAVEALKITGTYTAFSLDGEFTTYKTKSGSYYGDIPVGEHRVVEAYDGQNGWTIDPWMEILFPRRLNAGEQNMFIQKAEYFTPFLNYKEKGHKVEFAGKEKVDGMEMLVLKLERATGGKEIWYLNAKTYLEYKCESQWVDFTSSCPGESFFDDFRTVNGLVIPFFVERIFRQRNRIIQVEKVEVNPELAEHLLEMPKSEEMKKLDFLKGEWDIQLEVRTRRGTWNQLGTSTSAIDYVSTNLLQEKMNYEHGFPVTRIVQYAFNQTSGKYIVSAFNDLRSTIRVFEGDFVDNNFVMVDSKEEIGEEVEANNIRMQYSFTNIGSDSFVMERKVSRDNGANWNPVYRFTYTRTVKTSKKVVGI